MTNVTPSRVLELQDLVGQPTRDTPPYEQVLTDCQRARVAAAYYDAAVSAGLLVDSVHIAAQDAWPADVLAAMERLSLDAYSPQSWTGLVRFLNADEQRGLVSSIKGTVLELQFTEAANAGAVALPGNADTVELASATNQPGFDATLLAGDTPVGHVQMKAVEDWRDIEDHLERYPDVDMVVTTSEAAAAATANGLGAHVMDSGISNAELTSRVAESIDNLSLAHAANEVVPEIAIAAVMLSAVMKVRAGGDRREIAEWARAEVGVTGAAHLAGLGVEVATGAVVLRPLTTMSTRLAYARAKTSTELAGRAQAHRDALAALPPLPVQR